MDSSLAIISAITGFDLSGRKFTKIGEKVWNLERVLAVEARIGRKDNTISDRFFEEVLPEGNAKVVIVDRSGYERMGAEYYELRRCDVETEIPLSSTLVFLGLTDFLRVDAR